MKITRLALQSIVGLLQSAKAGKMASIEQKAVIDSLLLSLRPASNANIARLETIKNETMTRRPDGSYAWTRQQAADYKTARRAGIVEEVDAPTGLARPEQSLLDLLISLALFGSDPDEDI